MYLNCWRGIYHICYNAIQCKCWLCDGLAVVFCESTQKSTVDLQGPEYSWVALSGLVFCESTQKSTVDLQNARPPQSLKLRGKAVSHWPSCENIIACTEQPLHSTMFNLIFQMFALNVTLYNAAFHKWKSWTNFAVISLRSNSGLLLKYSWTGVEVCVA